MKELFTHWEEVRDKFRRAGSTLWLFDFDGTLAPVARHPRYAMMRPSMRKLLRRLADSYPGRVGILSGRLLGQVRQKVGVPGLIYGGVHGRQIQGPGVRFTYPLLSGPRKALASFKRRARLALRTIPGAWVENKKWSLVIHYRQVGPAMRRRMASLLLRLLSLARSQGFHIQRGQEAVEIFADTGWDKGRAALWLKPRRKARMIFYVGDDVTDETAFRALNRADVSVRVGFRADSRAEYYLKRQGDLTRLLQKVLSL